MNRRQFVQRLMVGATGPMCALNFQSLALANGLPKLEPQRRLVLVELAGANDGLNTLVPFKHDEYHAARPTLGLKANAVVPLSDSLGVHKDLEPLMPLWESGDMAWIQGLGYPVANRSHFASLAFWEQARDGNSKTTNQGWMTHAIEHQLPRSIADPHGISLVADMDIFASESGRWLSLKSTDQIQRDALPTSSAKSNNQNNALALVLQRLGTLDLTLSRLADKVQKGPQIQRFRGGSFGEQLRQVAKLVAAGVDTPVLRVRLKGFDTHHYQQAEHAQLMRTLAESLSDFSTSLKAMGEWDNTVVMSYSEFGRRVAENRSQGTDHGTAAPHMLLGGDVRGGFYSEEPSLLDLVDGDMQHTMDYRSVYQRVLVDGLGIKGELAHLSQFQDVRLGGLIQTS